MTEAVAPTATACLTKCHSFLLNDKDGSATLGKVSFSQPHALRTLRSDLNPKLEDVGIQPRIKGMTRCRAGEGMRQASYSVTTFLLVVGSRIAK
jgi:hypothetical protein